MQRIVIVYKKDISVASLAQEVAQHLGHLGKTVLVEAACPFTKRAAHDENYGPELIISLGGDGTLLHAVRVWGGDQIPVLGVNVGRLGFMAAVELADFWPVLRKVLDKQFKTDSRLMLKAVLRRDEQVVATLPALNDVVINKGALARIMDFQVSVSGSTSWPYRADGLIIATPTGSTAYNLSAGGPVVHPSLNSMVLTPICPFTLASRPILMPAEAEFNIVITSPEAEAHLTADGQVTIPLQPGDVVLVKKSDWSVSLVANPKKDFWEILRTKLGWV